MRRLGVVLGLVGLVLSVGLPSASATTTTTVEKWLAGYGYGSPAYETDLAGLSCAVGGHLPSQDPLPLTINGPADPLAPSTPPTSWGADPAGTTGYAFGPSDEFGDPHDVPLQIHAGDTLKLDVENGTSGVVRLVTQVAVAPLDLQQWTGQAVVSGPANQWTTLDASNLVYNWTGYDTKTDQQLTDTGTATDFASRHPSSTGALAFGARIAFGCDGRPFQFQHLQFGPPGAEKVWDYGTLAQSITVVSTNTAPLVAGQRARINGWSWYHAGPTASLRLQDMPNGTPWTATMQVPGTAYDDVALVGETFSVPWTSRITGPLLHNLKYSASYAAGNGVDAATTMGGIIEVSPKVQPTYPSVIYSSRLFAVRGTTYPAKPGATVTLWAQHGATRVKVAAATVNSQGAYKLVGAITGRTSWSLWITTPADSYNAAGNSGHTTFTAR